MRSSFALTKALFLASMLFRFATVGADDVPKPGYDIDPTSRGPC